MDIIIQEIRQLMRTPVTTPAINYPLSVCPSFTYFEHGTTITKTTTIIILLCGYLRDNENCTNDEIKLRCFFTAGGGVRCGVGAGNIVAGERGGRECRSATAAAPPRTKISCFYIFIITITIIIIAFARLTNTITAPQNTYVRASY